MFAVIWVDAALDKLADAIVAADPVLRQTIEAIVERMNRTLHTDPGSPGESRSPGRRIALEPPCGIYFSIAEASNGIVRVTKFFTY